MTTASEMQAKVAKWVADVDRQELFINGTADQDVVLRDGRRLKTMAKLEAEAGIEIDRAELAANNAVGAQNAVALDRQRAENARDLAAAAAMTAPNVYATEAAGRAAVADNQTFWVDGADLGPGLYRRQNAGASTLLTRMLSTSALAGGAGSSFVTFTADGGANGRSRPVQDVLREVVHILNFKNDDGSVPGSGGDDTTAMTKALGAGRKVRIPGSLRIKCNVIVPPTFAIEGDASRFAVIEPFDKTKAAILIPNDGFYWGYGRSITNVYFEGVGRTGIGVAMGTTGPADTNGASGIYPMYSGSMTFRNVTFRDLEKGFMAGCGNIGVEFYTCNAANCKYGFYFIDSKRPADDNYAGDAMHAGCKYFYGGEIDGCEVGVYVHNVTEGFGAISFYGTIIEYNDIGFYCYANNIFFPIAFYDVWNEGNGQAAADPQNPALPKRRAGVVNLDAWNGGVRTNTQRLPRTVIIEGTRCEFNYFGGFVTDIVLDASNSRVITKASHIETNVGTGGGPFIVSGNGSTIEHDDPKTLGGMGIYRAVTSRGIVHLEATGHEGDPDAGYFFGTASRRPYTMAPTLNKIYGMGTYASGNTEGVSISGTKPLPLVGFQNYTAGVSQGGRVFPYCNALDFTTTSANDFLLATQHAVTTADSGWWIFTYDIRRLDGVDVTVWIGDLGPTQIITGVSTAGLGADWTTVAAMAFLPAGRTFQVAFQTPNPGHTVFQFGAYQARRFATRSEAQAFLAARCYVADGADLFLVGGTGFAFKVGNLNTYRVAPNFDQGSVQVDAAEGTAKRWDWNLSHNVQNGGNYRVNGVKVVGEQQPAIADAGATDAKVAAILAAMRAHGLIAS